MPKKKPTPKKHKQPGPEPLNLNLRTKDSEDDVGVPIPPSEVKKMARIRAREEAQLKKDAEASGLHGFNLTQLVHGAMASPIMQAMPDPLNEVCELMAHKCFIFACKGIY